MSPDVKLVCRDCRHIVSVVDDGGVKGRWGTIGGFMFWDSFLDLVVFFFHWKFLVLTLGVALVASVSIDQGHVS